MEKPIISLTICSYNQERYIEECVRSALMQTYSPLEIVISDDCSPDSTFSIIKKTVECYNGPHKVIINCNPTNLGISANLSKAVSLSSGLILVDCAGDDSFEENKVEAIYNAWIESGSTAMAFFSNATLIDERSQGHGLLFDREPHYCKTMEDFLNDKRSVFKQMREPSVWIHGATAAYNRDLYNCFGPIPKGVLHEDGVLAFRALLLGSIVYINEPLTNYRVHMGSISYGQNYKHVVKLQKNEYKYLRAQLNDAKMINSKRGVIRKVRYLLFCSYIKRFIFSIPFLNTIVVGLLKNH